MIKTIVGDILDSTEDIICQQVNCQGTMGAGVAKAIYTRWPIVKKSYQRFCRRFPSPDALLGRWQLVEVEPHRYVTNIFGQLQYGRDRYRRYTDYTALTNAFDEIRNTHPDKSLAFPFGFGCGLANGDWEVVSGMIDAYFHDMDVRIYRLPAEAAAPEAE